ncbi:ATP-dependent DNA ligase [Paenibacillus sp. FSL L8-0709]|uniref:ATP-dependent DNA ligase n=1 Tax=Paenibacillus sp. FSL L8-0709 TaxID=2975312 RepID=UPI0030FC61A0
MNAMLLDEINAPFESENHIAELKIDGIRGLVNKQDRVKIYSRHQNDITSRFEEITEAATRAVPSGTKLDGEIVVCDLKTGKPDFEATMSRFQSTRRKQITPGLCYVAFDILSYKGKDTTSLPLMKRKELLEEALTENELIKRIRYVEQGFIPLFDKCREQQLEGIVLKQRDAQYFQGKRPKNIWQRVIAYNRAECLITGYSKVSHAWSIGVSRNGEIVPAGLLKHGLNTPIGKTVFPFLKQAVIKETDNFVFVHPFVKIGVRFRYWTRNGKMRLPVLEEVIF